jgi:CheY-like chemotaxis protein
MEEATVQSREPVADRFSSYQPVVLGLLIVLLSKLAVPRLAPAIGRLLNTQFDPWARPSTRRMSIKREAAVGDKSTSKGRADGRSFEEFAAEFRAGPGKRQANPAAADQDYADANSLFLEQAQVELALAENFLAEVDRSPDTGGRRKLFAGLLAQIGSLKRKAQLTNLLSIWQMVLLLESFLEQLVKNSSTPTPSAIRSIGGALELLKLLCVPDSERPTIEGARLLIVDDDAVSRLAVASALKPAFGSPCLAEHGQAAIVLARENAFDVVFVDVEMPEIDGFETCVRIHQTPLNRKTPVVFVTSHWDYESRTKSARSGGKELIAKPFLGFELALQALTLVLRGRLTEPDAGQVLPAPAIPSAAETGAVSAAVAITEPDPIGESAACSEPSPGSFVDAFFTGAQVHSEIIRTQLGGLMRLAPEGNRRACLEEMYLHARALACEADHAEVRMAFRLASALEAMLKNLVANPDLCTVSVLDTASAAADLLDDLCRIRHEPDASEHISILVADDDPVARRVLCGVIQFAFGEPDVAADGQAAVALAAQKHFDLIFMDMIMPGMDGLAACSKIRETALNRGTPVVFVTSANDALSREQARLGGASGFIPKPALATEVTLTTLTYALGARINRWKNGELVQAEFPARRGNEAWIQPGNEVEQKPLM